MEEAFKKLICPKEWRETKFTTTFMRDEKKFRWYGGQTAPCDHLLRMKFDHGAVYDVGVVARPDGGWNLQWDSCLNPYVGNDGEKIMSLYAEEVCRKHAADTGMTMETQELEDGNLRIELLQV